MTLGPVDIAAVAANALGVPVRSAVVELVSPIAYDPFIAGRTVARVAGSAETGAGPTPWVAIVKRTEGAGLRFGRRELDAYRLGLGPGADGLRAPGLLGFSAAEDHVELWLEEVTDEFGGAWPIDRYAVAAAHIARWDITMRDVDSRGLDVEREWAAHHGQPWRVSEVLDELRAMRGSPEGAVAAAAIWDPDLVRTAALVASTSHRIQRLAAFPAGLLHHDLVRSNLLAVAGGSTVAIDWEVIGPGPLGVDLAPLVVGSVRRGEASADDLPDLERMVLEAYVAAVDPGDEAAVREAYRLSLGLRWHVVLGTLRVLLDPSATRVRGSRPDESRAESLHHMTILARHLLASADTD